MTKREILLSSSTIAVVGLSDRPDRPSYGVARYLARQGFRVLGVNPLVDQADCYPRLEDVPVPVDIVDIFRRSEYVPEIVESAIRIGARCVWMQEGVIHEAAAQRAREAGLFVVMNACILKEHSLMARA